MLAALFTLALATTSSDPAPCGNPRAAAATFLANLRDERFDLRKASRCAEESGMSRSERERAVQVLKQALDAVGARVRIDELSDAPGFVDPKSYEPMVVLTRELPRVRLERLDDGQWMLPHSVLAQADDIYDNAVAIDLHHLKKTFPPWAQRAFFGIAAWQVGALLLLVLIGLALRFLVVTLLVWRGPTLLASFKIQSTRAGLTAVARPLGTLALAGVLALLVPSVGLSGRGAVLAMLGVRIVAALAALTFCYRIVDIVAEQMVKRAADTPSKMDDHIVPLVRRVLKIVVVSLAVVLVLQAFDVNVGSLVAGLGIGGLAVALAAKDTIGNFFGSVAIFLDRPFQIGDWVVAGDVEGTIEHVGFRSTQIRTIKDTVVSVPNQRLADQAIDNWGARRARRVRLSVALAYSTSADQIEAFCDGVRAVIAAHPHTRKDDVEVHLNDFGDSALTFLVHFYVVRPSWGAELRARHEILLDIVRLGRGLGVVFAYPTHTVHVSPDAPAAQTPSTDELVEVIRGFGPGGAHVVAPGPRILPAPPSEPAPAPKDVDAPPREP